MPTPRKNGWPEPPWFRQSTRMVDPEGRVAAIVGYTYNAGRELIGNVHLYYTEGPEPLNVKVAVEVLLTDWRPDALVPRLTAYEHLLGRE